MPRLPVAGLLFAVTAYSIWGFSPIYFKAAGFMPPLELTAHRVLWACLICSGLVLAFGKLPLLRQALADPKLRRVLVLMAALVLTNWLIFVWAIDRGQVMACSLGYFINPLITTLLGRFVLGEMVRPIQWAALALAAVGVGVLVSAADSGIWLALSLTLAWACYALLRKRHPVDSLTALSIEMTVLLPAALAYLGWLAWTGAGSFGRVDGWSHLLILLAGPITAAPLAFFAAGQRRLSLASMGLLQYISPSLQFLLAVLAWNEPFTRGHLIAFACIWTALAIYSWGNLRSLKKG